MVKGFAEIKNGKLIPDEGFNKAAEELKNIKGEIVFLPYDKPHHWLYKYYYGYLLEDIMQHIGDADKDNLHWFFKTKYLTIQVKDLNEVPVKFRKTSRTIQRVKEIYDRESGELIATNKYYDVTFSTASIDGRMFREYIKKIEMFFMDFLGGGMSERTNKEGIQYRDQGFEEE